MKTIGLLGGMSWQSTAEYYRLLNTAVQERLGGLHSARILLYSLEFAEIKQMQHAGRWDEVAAVLIDGAGRLERGGADLLLLCTNTMHKVAGSLAAATRLPLLHIADPTGEAIRAAGLSRVGLLGTQFTMEEAFYTQRMVESYGLEILIPEEAERKILHAVIFDELCQGLFREESRAAYRAVMQGLVARGAQGIILGCTEIGLLVGPADASVPLFDTTRLHAERAVALALEGAHTV